MAADDGVASERLAGADRYATAAELALATFDSADTALVASGETWPDALVAGYGPSGTDAPILLSRKDHVPQATLDALEALGPQTVSLLGGEAALDRVIETQLLAAGHDTLVRIAGADRYGTAARMLDGRQTPAVGTLDGDRTAFLASGETFADALSAGPVAARADLPLLLTPPAAPHPGTDEALAAHGIERIVIVGGDAAVSSAIVHHYRDEGYTVERWAGPTRTATATTVADNAVARLGFTPARVLLARGDDFPDALTASVHGAALAAPLLLSHGPDRLSDPTRSWLERRCPDVDEVRVLGGSAAVTVNVLARAVDAAEGCRVSTLPTSLTVSDDRVVDEDGRVLLTTADLADAVERVPDFGFGGPTQLTATALSADGRWIAVSGTSAAHGYGFLHDVAAGESHLTDFAYGSAVRAHSWSPDDRFALFTIGTAANTDLLKVVDRAEIEPFPDTGFVVEVDQEGDPPFAYEFVEWQAPHTLCFTFEGTSSCIDVETRALQAVQ